MVSELLRDMDVDEPKPCPLGCGFVPTSGTEAGRHLVGHFLGTNSTGKDQLEGE